MSKFLKFIVHLVIIATIFCILALFIPPLFGIKTVIIDDSYTGTNMLTGSVTYAREIAPSELNLGDDIIIENGKTVYRYHVIQPNLTEGTCMVKNPSAAGDHTETVEIGGGVWKTLFAIEYMGYLLIATQSREGMILILLAVLVLIILYVIAELWRKKPSEEQNQVEEIHLKSEKELRREEQDKAAQRKREEREIRRGRKNKKKKEKNTVRTGGFVDEISEEEDELERELEKQLSDLENPKKANPIEFQEAAAQAHLELKKEILATTSELPKIDGEIKKSVEDRMTLEEEMEEARENEMPVVTTDELAQEIIKNGYAPDVLQDELSKVVVFDFSDILEEEKGEKK